MPQPEQTPKADTPVWSAHNLPKPKPSRILRFSAMALAIGLVTVVLASAIKNPIQTSGTKMEPQRFTTSAQQRQERTKTASGAPDIVVASDAP